MNSDFELQPDVASMPQPDAEVAETWAAIEQDFRANFPARARRVGGRYNLSGAIDGEDIAAQAYLKVLEAAHRTGPRRVMGAWIHIAIDSTARDHVQRMARIKIDPTDSEDLQALMPSGEPTAGLLAPHEHFEQASAAQEILDVLDEHVKPIFVEPFVRHVLGGLSFEEVGESMDIAETTARTRTYRLRKAVLELSKNPTLDLPEGFRGEYQHDDKQ